MKFKNVKFFQEGGAMAPQEEMPQGGGDPMLEILMACQQAVETQDCQIALQVCQTFLEMLSGGGAAPEPQPEQAPMPEPEGEPVYRKGGILVKRIRK